MKLGPRTNQDAAKCPSHLVELPLLPLQVGDDLPQVVLVHQQVVQLLLQTRLGFVQLVEGAAFLLQALVHGLQVPLQPLLHLLRRVQAGSILLHLLLQVGELQGTRVKQSNRGVPSAPALGGGPYLSQSRLELLLHVPLGLLLLLQLLLQVVLLLLQLPQTGVAGQLLPRLLLEQLLREPGPSWS